jgi:hypothetical protein
LERGDTVVGIDNIPTLPLTLARLHRSGGTKREILSNPDAIGIRAMGEMSLCRIPSNTIKIINK